MSFKDAVIKREICDPLYGYVHLTNVETSLIDTEAFQRLDRLYQTPTAHYVFPNATHTRKAHSLGVLFLVNLGLKRLLYRQSKKLQDNIKPFISDSFTIKTKAVGSELDDFDKVFNLDQLNRLLQSSRIVGLCHDIGHGPFSHIFQEACNSMIKAGELEWKLSSKDEFKHEYMSSCIIKEKFKEYLADEERDFISDLLLGEEGGCPFVHSMIDGPYDVDKLDYVGRDAYHTGALEYGNVNYLRILDGLRVKDNRLLISSDSLESVVNTFFATQFMYLSVYYHKTTRIFDFMLYEAMMKIPDYIAIIINDYEKFISTDDYSFISDVKNKRGDSKEFDECYAILSDVLNRKKKYKLVSRELITLDIQDKKDDELEKIKKELEEKYAKLELKIDYSGKVKPIRIDTAKIKEWLDSENFYDELEQKTEKLENISKAYYDVLNKLQLTYGVYVGIDKYTEDLRKNITDEVKGLLKELTT